MPDTAKYTGLSIENKRYDRIRREFDAHIAKDTPMTFTNWCVTSIEAAVERHKFVSSAYPELKMISAEKGTVIIFDGQTKKAVTISITKKGISCSEDDSREKYILFTLTHPMMIP
jgi:hypothetical protein